MPVRRRYTRSRPGANRLMGRAGNDTLTGAAGNDLLYGDAGEDTINAIDGASFVDRLYCGSETDTTSVDARDIKAADCDDLILARP